MGLGIVVEGDEAGDEMSGIVREEFAGKEIDGAIEDSEEGGIGIEKGVRGAEFGQGTGDAKERVEAREVLAAFGMFEEALPEAFGALFGQGGSLIVVGLQGGRGESEDVVGVIEMPAGTVEEEPTPIADVANAMGVLFGEMAGIGEVAQEWGVESTKISAAAVLRVLR
jgi:hypothetical protein